MGRTLTPVRRSATALIALLAMVALVTAAGSYDVADQPRLGVDATTIPDEPPEPRNGTPAPADSTDTDDGETAAPPDDRQGQRPAGAEPDGDGGVTGLVVAGLVGALLVAAALAVVLTDDDTRAPPPSDDDRREGDAPPGPTVDPAYDAPPENAVLRAWRSLTDRVEGVDDATTPGEAAARAADRGLPTGVVDEITDEFEAVRYGDAAPTGERERRAEGLAADLESETTGADCGGGDE